MNISEVKGIGKKRSEAFSRVGITTLEDLLFKMPTRYINYSILDYTAADFNDEFVLEGYIVSKVFYKQMKKGIGLTAFSVKTINNTKVLVRLFGASFYQYKFRLNDKVFIYGKKKENNLFYAKKIFDYTFIPHIDSIYQIEDIPDSLIQRILSSYLANNELNYLETIPLYLVKKYRLLGINEFLRLAHFPLNTKSLKELERRIKYKQFLKYTLSLEIFNKSENLNKKEAKTYYEKELNQFILNLPFPLTTSQKETLQSIFHDMTSNIVMNRLVQGDVGSGKTIIAIVASLLEYLNGGQTVVLAPTEILASQHYENFKKYFQGSGINIALLTGSLKKKEKDEIIASLASGKTNILISTHALLYQNYRFKHLGLYIVDEQHRFGVLARKSLVEAYKDVDALFLTATPIPRTLGLTKFGNMDISSLKDKPLGRKKVKTKVLTYNELNYLYADLEARISKKEQAYIVVSQIKENDLPFLDIKEAYDMIREQLPTIRLGIIHGALKEAEKKRVMDQFLNQELDALVSTTVIEVGLDVKNATGIYIFDASRFGLATLHQLRGRVGRNDLESDCFLITKKYDTERLKSLEEIDDCFTLADLDLKLRGPGDLLGVSQSGFTNFDFMNDGNIFKCAKDDAHEAFSLYEKGVLLDNTMKHLIEKISIDNKKLN